MFKRIYNYLFAVDSVGYSFLSAVIATLLLCGLCKGFVWLYSITPFWAKLVIAASFCIVLFVQMRIDQKEQNKRDQEEPTEE